LGTWTLTARAEIPAVPEPATWGLWSVGAAVLAMASRRRKRAH
jgi:hypothetical protein